MHRALGFAVAFVAGWAVMALEILAGRLLASVFGYSVYQWGALIGTVMAALAAGYALGGRFGDGPRAASRLRAALWISCGYTFLLPWLSSAMLEATRELGPILGAVAASLLLVGPQSLLLATVSPIVTRVTAHGGIASSAGRVYAISTVGSIGGVFFTSFYSIPEMGTRASGYACAILLGVSALAAMYPRRKAAGIAAAALMAVAAAAFPREIPLGEGVLFEGESVHNLIRVADHDGRRYFFMNYEKGVQTHVSKGSFLTGTYRDAFLLGPHLTRGKKFLLLGVAGGASLRQVIQAYPEVEATGVDLDPLAMEVGKRFFELEGLPRTRLVVQDARWYLATSEEKYDVIGIDLYVTGHIPYFTATREFFELVRDRLETGGIVVMNVFAPGRGRPELLGPMIETIRKALPGIAILDAPNAIVLASRDPAFGAETVRRALEAPLPPGPLAEVARQSLAVLKDPPFGSDWPVFTDDRSDVEFRTFWTLTRR